MSALRQFTSDSATAGLSRLDSNQLQSWNVGPAGSGAVAWCKTGTIVSGKIYCEMCPTVRGQDMFTTFGLATAAANAPYGGGVYGMFTGSGGCGLNPDGYVNNGARTTDSLYAFGQDDICQIAIDTGAGDVWFGKNGTWISGDPAVGTSPTLTGVAGSLYFYAGMYSCGIGAGTFQNRIYNTSDNINYPIPSGFTVYNEQ